VPDEDTVELIFDPGGGAIHDVEVRTAGGVDPLVAGLPETVVDLGVRAGERPPELDRHFARRVDVKIEVGGGIV
jgi:hypothetical protein